MYFSIIHYFQFCPYLHDYLNILKRSTICNNQRATIPNRHLCSIEKGLFMAYSPCCIVYNFIMTI